MMLVIPNLFSQNLCTLEAIAGCKENTTAQFKLITNSSTFSQLVASTALLPAAQAAISPQYLVVCGTLTNDIGSYTFAPGSEIIFTTNTSGIIVAPGKKLICRNTYLHGCKKLWKGIELLTNSGLDMRDSRVEDGVNAVWLKDASNLTCINSKFNGNVISVLAGGIGYPHQYSNSILMYGTVISGSKALLEQFNFPNSTCTTLTPLNGIEILNSKYVSIGVNNYATNSIEDFKYTTDCAVFPYPSNHGIRSLFSNLKVTNTKFKNIDPETSGTCLNFTSDIVKTSTLNFTGLGISASSPNTFESSRIGVIANGNYQISNSKFRSLFNGIVQNHLANAPFTGRILNNDFAHIDDHTIFIDNVFPFAGLTVTNNNLVDDSNFNDMSGLGFIDPRSGIYLKNFIPNVAQPSVINSNTFRNQSKPDISLAIQYAGVRLSNINGTLVRLNTFIDDFPSSPVQYRGVLLNTASARLFENNFSGIGNFGPHPSTAVHVLASPGAWLSCNQFNNQRIGVHCSGNSDVSRFDLNQFGIHQRGLRLDQTAIIGPQDNLQNKWPLNTSLPNMEALFVNQTNTNFIIQSQFRIHDPNQASEFWPNPRMIDGSQDPGIWFIPGAASNVTCAQPTANDEAPELAQPEPSPYENSVINGSFEPINGFEADKMSAQIQLYAKLLKHPEWMTNNSTISTWYNAQQNTGISNWGTTHKAVAEDMATISPSENAGLKQKYAEINAKLEEIATIDESIGQAIDDATLTNTLSTLRAQKSAELDVKTTEAGSLMAGIRQNQQSRANAALPLINSLPSDNEYSADLKTMFTIYAQTALSGSAPSEKMYETIQQIAIKCLYSGGLAVKLARASSKHVLNWEEFDKDCMQTANRESGFSATLSGRIYPNPAKDFFTFKSKSKVTNGHLELRDILGVVIKTWKFENVEQFDCQLPANLPSGIYSIIFSTENKRPEVYQLSVNNKD